MSKAVSINQAFQGVLALATKINWAEVDGDKFQQCVVDDLERAGKEFALFLQNGARVHLGPFTVTTRPFDHVGFLGTGWSLIPEEHEARNDALTEVDFSKVNFETCFKDGETSITGEEKLKRLKAGGNIRLGASVFLGLWEDYQVRKENSILERLYREKGITYMDFFGDVLLAPRGDRRVLCLCRSGAGDWYWYYDWLDCDWGVENRSASLASQV